MARTTCGYATRLPSSRLTRQSLTSTCVVRPPDPHSRSGRGVRVIGYSHRRRAVLTVILVPRDDGAGYWGANGWEANSSDRRRYERGQ